MVVREKQQAILQQIAQKRWEFWCKLPERLTELSDSVGEVLDAEQPAPALQRLHALLHRLVGSAGTLGQPSLSQEARGYEQWVKTLLDTGVTGYNPALQRLQSLVPDLSATILEPKAAEADPKPPTVTAGLERSTIWVLEPDEQEFSALQRQLSPFNYRLQQVVSPAHAAELLGKELPQLVVVNVSPFYEDALCRSELQAFCATLEERGLSLLFIAEEDRFDLRAFAARQLGSGFFVKPVSVPRLTSRIDLALAHAAAPPERVLIVEDDYLLAEHYRNILEAAGMRAHILERPDQIMAELQRFVPELVLMDLHMPDYSGTELAAVVRQYERWESLPIVYLSAESDMTAQIRAMRFGADDFLSKPVVDAQLVAAVHARIERARQLSEQITKDSLTGLLRHASIKEHTVQELLRAERDGHALSWAMIDIDHFKHINDTYGHPVGDLVISSLAMLLKQRVRRSDIVGRYGGEEFAVILPHCDRGCAETILNNIRELFSNIEFDGAGETFHCTLSAGVASRSVGESISSEHLIASADSALYKAKQNGRNRVA